MIELFLTSLFSLTLGSYAFSYFYINRQRDEIIDILKKIELQLEKLEGFKCPYQ
jgi:hypothetical protein